MGGPKTGRRLGWATTLVSGDGGGTEERTLDGLRLDEGATTLVRAVVLGSGRRGVDLEAKERLGETERTDLLGRTRGSVVSMGKFSTKRFGRS